MGAMAFQITGLTIVYSYVYSGADQRKHQSSVSLAFLRGIHRWPVNSLHKWQVMWKMFPFDDVIMWDRNPYLVRMVYCKLESNSSAGSQVFTFCDSLAVVTCAKCWTYMIISAATKVWDITYSELVLHYHLVFDIYVSFSIQNECKCIFL